MPLHHPTLQKSTWSTLSLASQLGHVGSEVSRAARWQQKDPMLFTQAIERALELLDFTLADTRWRFRLKEIARAREMLCVAVFGAQQDVVALKALDRYFFQFALIAHAQK